MAIATTKKPPAEMPAMNSTVSTTASLAATFARLKPPPPPPEKFPGGKYGLKEGYEVGKMNECHDVGSREEGLQVG
jgi:hypothetical protein